MHLKTITEKDFELMYPCQINHIERKKNDTSIKDEDICSFNGCMYETYGPELDFVREMSKENRVLTIIESDEETDDFAPVWYITSGMHHVNRIGYLITEKPIIGDDFEVKLDF